MPPKRLTVDEAKLVAAATKRVYSHRRHPTYGVGQRFVNVAMNPNLLPAGARQAVVGEPMGRGFRKHIALVSKGDGTHGFEHVEIINFHLYNSNIAEAQRDNFVIVNAKRVANKKPRNSKNKKGCTNNMLFDVDDNNDDVASMFSMGNATYAASAAGSVFVKAEARDTDEIGRAHV